MSTLGPADVLLDRAREATGLGDYGDETLGDRLAIVLDAIESSDLDRAGEAAAAETIAWLLTTRLEFFADRARHAIADEEIVRPVFATGEPRSGTTLLHALLAVDPRARALRFWEVMYPSPPPGLASGNDPRRAKADDDWRDILRTIPPWLVSHPYNDMLGDGLPECERTWAFDFRSMTPSAWWRVPMTMRPALPQDPAAQYRIHRMMLQQLQFARPEQHWVLKGFHGHRLEALFDAYPDASVVWVHRDPVKIAASQTVAFGQIDESLAGSLDWDAYVVQQLDLVRSNIAGTMAEPLIDDDRIHHVPYQDFVADPVGTIAAFHDRHDIRFADDTEDAMRTYLRDNPGDRHGRFAYSTDVLPVPVEELDEEFADYRQRFGVERGR